MSKVVKHNYPVQKLPADLQKAVVGATAVSVTLEPDESDRSAVSLQTIRARIAARRNSPDFKQVSTDEAVERIRVLRDEWD